MVRRVGGVAEGGAVSQISEMAVRGNAAVLEYGRTVQAAASGAVAGILGLTSLAGFAFYFATAFVQAALWWVKTGGEPGRYFVSNSTLVSHSLLSGLFTYILFWTFLYGMVHVY